MTNRIQPEIIEINVAGKNIRGLLQLSRKCHNKKAIIMCNGLNGEKTEQHRMGWYLGRMADTVGIDLIRFDYRGQGSSDGEFYEFKMEDKVNDVNSIIEYYINRCCEVKDIYLIGYSHGAQIASLVTSVRERIAGVCLWSPIFFPDHLFFSGNTNNRCIRVPDTNIIAFPFYGLWISSEFLRDLNSTEAFEKYTEYTGRKICFFGEKDPSMKPVYDELLNKKMYEITIIKGAQHIYTNVNYAKEVLTKTLEWINGF